MRDYTIIGITGSTGAGKSTVTKYFSDKGCHIIDADYLSRVILEKGSDCLLQIRAVFGDDILNPDGTLNRKLLAQRAFSSKENTQRLNNITHPHILMQVLKMIDNIRRTEKNALIIFDAPVLFESNMDILCDYVIAVVCPLGIRRERIIKRDNLTLRDANMRIKAQKQDDFYISRSDFVINGNDNLSGIYGKADEVLKKISKR